MTTLKVIYHGFTHKHTRKIIDYLYDEYRWQPIYMSGTEDEDVLEWVKLKYNKCILQDAMMLRQAQFDYNKIGKPVPIDAEIINALSKYELNFIGFLHDTTGWNYSFHERKLFYYDILKYWNTVINIFKPDVFVSFTRPHTPAEYSLYLLCKYYYDIDVIFINPLPLFDHNHHFISTSLYNSTETFIDIYKKGLHEAPSPVVHKYLKELRSDKGKTPEYILNVYCADKKNVQINTFNFLKTILKSVVNGAGKKQGLFDWKKNKKPYDSLSSRMNALQYQFHLHRLAYNNLKLRSIYKGYCKQVNFAEKYMYFSAPYQPESVTAINGGVFEEIFLVLDILSATLPDDWVLYYKEHPGTFRMYAKGSLKRNRYFYERVSSYKKLKIIPYETDSFKLIDNSQAVASISGTTTWEATVRGKPAMCFGNAWYDGCTSVFNIRTLNDAENAMIRIKNGFLPNDSDVENYLASIEKIAIKDIIHRNFNLEIEKCTDPDYKMRKIADGIKTTYDRFYSSNCETTGYLNENK